MRGHLSLYFLGLALFLAGGQAAAQEAGPQDAADDGQEADAAAQATPTLSARAVIGAADMALQGGRLVEARALLDRLVDMAPPPDMLDAARLLRAELLLMDGQGTDARHMLDALTGTAARGCRATAARAAVRVQSGDLDVARDGLNLRAEPCADDPFYWRARARVDLALGRAGAAVAGFRRALALQPGKDALQGDLAVALIAQGEAAEAAEMLAMLLRRAPRSSALIVNLDFANGMLGRMPLRASADDDAMWSRRLQFAGAGARRAGRGALAEALFAQALIERPRHDQDLWRQFAAVREGQ